MEEEIKKLELIKGNLQRELSELKLELKTVIDTKVSDMSESQKTKPKSEVATKSTTGVISSVIQRLKLNILSTCTGLHITEMSMKSVFKGDKPWFRYEIESSIEKLQFVLIFNVNKSLDFEYSDTEIKQYEYEELDIKMLNSDHQSELTKMIRFYRKHSNYLGSAVLSLEQYYFFHDTRANTMKNVLDRYSDYLDITLDPTTGYYALHYKGKLTKVYFLCITWSIVWDLPKMCLRNAYKCEFDHDDEQFYDDVISLLRKLCYSHVTLSEDEQFRILENAMIALKDADTRIASLTSNISD